MKIASDDARSGRNWGSMGSTEEPDRKRRHLSNNHSVSPPVKKQPVTPASEEKKVDASMLQYQNHKLAQQLDVQRNEINVLEGKLSQLRSRQASFDDNLAVVNRVWNQVVDDMELLTVHANSTTNGIHVSGSGYKEKIGSVVPSEQSFLERLLERGATESSTTNGSNGSVECGVTIQKASAKSVKYLLQAIDFERARNDELAASLRSGLSSNGAARLLAKTDEELQADVKRMRALMDALHLRHRELSAEVGASRDLQAKDRAEIRKLKGELEEASADLESSRQKLAMLRSQDTVPAGPPTPRATPTGKKFEFGNGGVAPEVSRETCQLEADVEEAKTLAAQRLSELHKALKIQLNLLQNLQHMQDKLEDQQHIISSQQYQSLSDQFQHLRSEVERCGLMVDQLQGERVAVLRREKEVILKAEAGDAARRAGAIADAQAADLELKLQQCMSECDTLQLRVEDACQAAGRKESVAELKKVITTLHKEMSMTQAQLYDSKEAGSAVHSLRAELQSLHAILERKTMESRLLSDQYAGRFRELSLLQDEVQILRDSEKELKLIMDMYNRETTDQREVRELQEAECIAQAQVKRLQLALDEHNLEMRVKAANEAEAACQQRLIAVEAEIAELRQSLEASHRAVMELRDALKAKKEEGDAYMGEIETIGQAYEDMQTQNQRLLQQIIECDDYNAQLISDSLKAKQLQTSVQAEKQALNIRMVHANAAADLHKQRITRLEDQAKTIIDQLGKATDESRQHISLLESAKRKAVETGKELASAKAALEATHKVLDEQGHKLMNVQLQLENERFEKRRAQEELEVLTIKVTRLHGPHDGGPMVERLQEEIKDYKAILKCSVCHDRPKEVVITKCYHLFCSPCIQRNLELRHRKCPGCGVPFGQSDVRTVYI